MFLNRPQDLPVLSPRQFTDVNNYSSIIIPNPALLSSLNMGGAHAADSSTTRRRSSPTPIVVAHALEIARDSDEGARNPAVANILEDALARIWAKIQLQPTTYVMTRGEFAVFNYFQDRFTGQDLATSARKRYWDHLEIIHAR